jgi:hypothetical protein
VQPASDFVVDDLVLRAAPNPGVRPTTTRCTPPFTHNPTTTTTTTRPTTTTTTTTTTPPRCTVAYSVASQWPGGFQAAVRLTNVSPTTIPAWTLGLTFGDGQRVTQAWGAGGFGQSGATATFTAPAWAPDLAPGRSVDVGFLGSWAGRNGPPVAITVNGAGCDGPRPTTTTSTSTSTTTTVREDCRWVMAVPGAVPPATTTTTSRTYSDAGGFITIYGWGLGGMYGNGSITWSSDVSRVTGLTGVTSWSQSGRVVSFEGLQWTGSNPRRVELALRGVGVSSLPASVKVNLQTCTYGL